MTAGLVAEAVFQTVVLTGLALLLLGYPRAPGRDGSLVVAVGSAALGAAAGWVLPPARSGALLFGAALPALAIVLLRPRGRDDLTGDERARIRLLSALVAGLTTIAVAVQILIRDQPVLLWAGRILPVAIAAEMLVARRRETFPAVRRRLRAGLLTALVATLIGGLFTELNTVVVAAIAAAPAALLLHPAYARTGRLLDRWLDGPRPTPYRVLAEIGSRIDRGAPDLDRVAEAVGQALNARTCRLTVRRPDRPDRRYTWPGPVADDEALVTLPVEELGWIAVDRATGRDAYRQRLLADIADSLVPVFEAHRLGIELERQLRAVRSHAAEIAGSRRRLVAEMDAERRRIERDLHDGAQHHLVSLRLALGLAEHRVATGTAEEALAALDRVSGLIDDAEAVMARTAVGVNSPLLAEKGLVAALRSELSVEVTTRGDVEARLPEAVAEAVWFCCLEAVGNARKYAAGARLEVSVVRAADRLEFGVHDDGPGWDMAVNDGSPGRDVAADGGSPSRGMRNLAARVRSLGGVLTVRSAPGEGTRVDGWIPLPDESLVAVVRAAIAEHGGSPEARKVGDELDRAAGGTRREQIVAADAALRALHGLSHGSAEMRHRLDRIRSGRHELAEVAAIDRLRADGVGLSAEEAEEAARLLGESGADGRSRLGLDPDADRSVVLTAAGRALAVWRGRASHPATAPPLRELAGTVVRSCERLLHQLAGP
ncbi:histidine kinase [Actinoplanes sp. NPDC051411]|uniref:sensor histidine kinase n=1 Tax=Actinoplanes sp. NPDC051411 TaxID=3155522 RepID=UPI00342CDFA0